MLLNVGLQAEHISTELACTPEDSVKFNFKHISHKAKASLWASFNFQPELMYTIVLSSFAAGRSGEI